jgi:hypothetical protein
MSLQGSRSHRRASTLTLDNNYPLPSIGARCRVPVILAQPEAFAQLSSFIYSGKRTFGHSRNTGPVYCSAGSI